MLKLRSIFTSILLLQTLSLFASVSHVTPNFLDANGENGSRVKLTTSSTEAYQRIPLYRFSRNDNPSHFFTALESEKEAVLQDLGDYFTLEGPSHYVIANHTLNSQPVYRMYNNLSGAHFYTASEDEIDNVLATMSWFSLEGIAFYVFLSPESGTLPVYRFYVPETGSHYFTIDEAEKNLLISSGQTIKQYDGISWYAYAKDGLTDEIRELIPESIMVAIKDMGLSINVGENPPSIENSFKCSPLILMNSNFSDSYEIGFRFADLYFKFSNQDNENLEIDIDTKAGSSVSTGRGGFIVGEESRFTVFATTNLTDTDSGHTYITLNVFSGKMTPTGIEGFEYAVVMLDDKGDPDDDMISNGQGRIFRDGDGFSPKVTDFVNATAIMPYKIDETKLPSSCSSRINH